MARLPLRQIITEDNRQLILRDWWHSTLWYRWHLDSTLFNFQKFSLALHDWWTQKIKFSNLARLYNCQTLSSKFKGLSSPSIRVEVNRKASKSSTSGENKVFLACLLKSKIPNPFMNVFDLNHCSFPPRPCYGVQSKCQHSSMFMHECEMHNISFWDWAICFNFRFRALFWASVTESCLSWRTLSTLRSWHTKLSFVLGGLWGDHAI